MGSVMSWMGLEAWWQKRQPFTTQQLDDYQDCTFFNRQDIIRLYRRFHSLNPQKVPSNMQGNRPSVVVLSFDEIERMPELRVAALQPPTFQENPFRRRICEVFSEDGYGNLSFDDFLDMFSVLSESAPLDLKLKYAFRVFDFDRDDILGKSDLEQAVQCQTREELTTEEIDFIVERILEESDLDSDGTVSFAEFEHVVSRSPDFTRTFHIRI